MTVVQSDCLVCKQHSTSEWTRIIIYTFVILFIIMHVDRGLKTIERLLKKMLMYFNCLAAFNFKIKFSFYRHFMLHYNISENNVWSEKFISIEGRDQGINSSYSKKNGQIKLSMQFSHFSINFKKWFCDNIKFYYLSPQNYLVRV